METYCSWADIKQINQRKITATFYLSKGKLSYVSWHHFMSQPYTPYGDKAQPTIGLGIKFIFKLHLSLSEIKRVSYWQLQIRWPHSSYVHIKT